MTLVLAHARVQVLELMRLPSFAVPTVGLPALLFLFFGVSAGSVHPEIAMASFAAFAAMSIAFFQFGVGLAVERSTPWERFVRALPVSPRARFAARVLAAAPFTLASAGLVVAVALATTDVALDAGRWARFAVTLLAGMVPLSLFGIALGYWATPKGALPLANVLYLGLAFAGGLWTRPPDLPDAVAAVSPYLPTRLWGEILWPAVDGRAWTAGPWLGLAGYALGFGLVAAWGYRRDEGERFR